MARVRRHPHDDTRLQRTAHVHTFNLCTPRSRAVTGQHADEDQIDQMIESGESETIFQKAILEQVDGAVRCITLPSTCGTWSRGRPVTDCVATEL